MQNFKKLKDNKIFKVIILMIKALFGLFIIAFVGIVCLQRFSDNKLSLFKYRMFTVVSESMAPKYKISDVLFAKDVEPSVIKIGDDISYQGTYGDIKGKIVTHQVIGIEQNAKGEYVFRAKGLSNIFEDPIIYEEQLYGKVVYKSAILSFIYKVVATNVGFYFCIIIPVGIIICYEVVTIMIEKEDKRRAKLNK